LKNLEKTMHGGDQHPIASRQLKNGRNLRVDTN
jgi:hypothetical protein